jgi:hypothetical protein
MGTNRITVINSLSNHRIDNPADKPQLQKAGEKRGKMPISERWENMVIAREF